jgi:hypothetical protein
MSVPSARSQEDRILWQLQAAFPEWTPAPVLSRISLQYNARIFSLRRKKGWEIENKVEVRDGVKHGYFRLATPGSFPTPKAQPSPTKLKNKITEAPQSVAPPSDNLFGESLMPDRSYCK